MKAMKKSDPGWLEATLLVAVVGPAHGVVAAKLASLAAELLALKPLAVLGPHLGL